MPPMIFQPLAVRDQVWVILRGWSRPLTCPSTRPSGYIDTIGVW